VNNELSGQTAKLIDSKKKVEEPHSSLNTSEGRLRRVAMRIWKNKWVMRGVLSFIVLVLIIALLVYFR
jgi:hypothetical protein